MSDKKNIHILELSTYSQPEIIEDSKNDWVEYGVNNDHYEFLIDRYKNYSNLSFRFGFIS